MTLPFVNFPKQASKPASQAYPILKATLPPEDENKHPLGADAQWENKQGFLRSVTDECQSQLRRKGFVREDKGSSHAGYFEKFSKKIAPDVKETVMFFRERETNPIWLISQNVIA